MIAHWDDVEAIHRGKGPMAAAWQRLGDTAGAKTIGVNRIRVDPGMLSTPPHSHGAAEEIYFVLGGAGLAWQDDSTYEVRPGDTIVQITDHFEHTFRAGPDGLDVLAFGTRHPTEYGWLPRSRALRRGHVWSEGRTDDPWDVEAEIGELEFAPAGARPDNVRNLDEVEADKYGDKKLAGSCGSQQSGLNWNRRASGKPSSPSHCHSAEKEFFVILEGGGTLELTPSPTAAERGAQPEEHELRAGHVVARPPGTTIAHRLIAGPSGLTYLAYGTRSTNDICFYPHSGKISFRGVGFMTRAEHLEYWDGEPRP